MGNSLLDIGLSGLQAAQIGLLVTGQNITNANTIGYSLEKVLQVAAPSQGFGFGFLGQGTQVATIARQYNDLIAKQINSSQSVFNQLDTYINLISPINNLIADPSVGLSPSLQSFFSSLQNLASNPSSLPSLQSSMSSAQGLVSQFQLLQGQLNQVSSQVNSQISASVSNINNYAEQLALLNREIQTAYAVTGNQPPNVLLDQRDVLINNLSKEIQISVVKEGNQYNVFIGNGQPLVMGGLVSGTLETVPSASNQFNLDVAYNMNGVIVPITENSLPGGNLGGLFAFRTNSLSSVQNSLGQIAIVLGSALNAQNKLGQTINGNMGTDLFTIAAPVIYPNSNNTGNAKLSAAITDPSALTADSYSLSYDGTNYIITNTSTNQVMSTFTSFPATPTPGVNVINGVTYTLSSGAMTAGDKFLISPTAAGASGFNLVTTDPTRFATAAPIATSSSATNTGSGVMTPGSVSTGFDPVAVIPPITLTYDSATNALTGFPAGSTIAVTINGVTTTYPNYVPGTPIPYTPGMSMSFNNMTVGLSGTPANGDSFTIGPNTNGKADNRNVLLMSALLTQNTMNNGTNSFQGAYAQLVNLVGNTTGQLMNAQTAESNLLKETTRQQQSLSGVNLDQETVNLVNYQQAYQASARLVAVANENFNVLLGLYQ